MAKKALTATASLGIKSIHGTFAMLRGSASGLQYLITEVRAAAQRKSEPRHVLILDDPEDEQPRTRSTPPLARTSGTDCEGPLQLDEQFLDEIISGVDYRDPNLYVQFGEKNEEVPLDVILKKSKEALEAVVNHQDRLTEAERRSAFLFSAKCRNQLRCFVETLTDLQHTPQIIKAIGDVKILWANWGRVLTKKLIPQYLALINDELK